MVGAIIQSWNFDDLVKLSGYRNVVSTNYPPTAVVHDGAADEKMVTNGVVEYYIRECGLSAENDERARQLLERLYGLGDWAAGEIVERHRRDQERIASGYHELRPRLSVPQMLVRRFVKRNPRSSIREISVGTSMSVAAVQAITDELCSRGILVRSNHSETKYDLSDTELARYQDLQEKEATGMKP
jgi:DNA-binding MarR family transcriptional regulator